MTATELRRELSARNLAWAEQSNHEVTYGAVPCVVHATQEDGSHGNFLPASWRRIQARPAWRRRLDKAYTASSRVARSHDRWRGELEAATSSDALLMNVFCYPGLLRRSPVLRLLGNEPESVPTFGIRAHIPFVNGKVDRTEVDLRLGDLLVEAKLTETSFQTARPSLMLRYRDLDTCFSLEDLPRTDAGNFKSYQLVRGVLAAYALDSRFAVILDRRRSDLLECWLEVLCAVKSSSLRSRLQVLSWQELAAATPNPVRQFLSDKYGIEAADIRDRNSIVEAAAYLRSPRLRRKLAFASATAT